jgi:NTP pyrophosphatase (non-canonical NTP hydrolase)
MKFNEYQKLAIRTVNPKLSKDDRLDMLALGLSGESGEVAESIKKWRWHDHPALDEEKLAKEIGDCMWYAAGVAETLDFTLSAAVHETVDTFVDRGGSWVQPFSPDDPVGFQRGVEEFLMVPPDERKDRPAQLSEVTHKLCSACNGLAEALCDLPEPSFRTAEVLRDIEGRTVGVLTACAEYAVTLGCSLETVLENNIQKLKSRYPEGFSADRSLNRPN